MLLASLIEVTSEYFQPNNVIQIFSAAFMALSAFMMYFTYRTLFYLQAGKEIQKVEHEVLN